MLNVFVVLYLCSPSITCRVWVVLPQKIFHSKTNFKIHLLHSLSLYHHHQLIQQFSSSFAIAVVRRTSEGNRMTADKHHVIVALNTTKTPVRHITNKAAVVRERPDTMIWRQSKWKTYWLNIGKSKHNSYPALITILVTVRCQLFSDNPHIHTIFAYIILFSVINSHFRFYRISLYPWMYIVSVDSSGYLVMLSGCIILFLFRFLSEI